MLILIVSAVFFTASFVVMCHAIRNGKEVDSKIPFLNDDIDW